MAERSVEGETYDTIVVGQDAQHHYTISGSVYEHFMNAYDVRGRLQVDEAYAHGKGFEARVMPGSVLDGFISHFLGRVFPGEGTLLHSMQIQYKSPSHPGDEILVKGTVMQKSDAVRVLMLDLRLTNLTRNRMAAKAKVQVGLLGAGA